jgi:hypothetical protein
MKKIILSLVFFLFTAFLVNGCSKSDDTTVTSTGGNRNPESPSSPIPSNGATGVSGFITVTWNCSDPDANDTLRYDVFAGSTSNPTTVVASDILNKAADIGVAAPHSTVYWRVTAKDNHGGSTKGPVWQYSTP